MNLLARNVYALTRDEVVSATDTLTASELASLEQLAKVRQTTPALLSNTWVIMADDYGWYPVINQLEEITPKDE